ncbi:SGNH/GDSL hydrolase family protein [Microbacterium sp. STN6]|uniref:SGNH/GDSL hydrolase family protein n=1 Tax=Microbacterium sp. STN6 TaxID=2995588 RepID=UPI002260C6BB|nr:SGNH/GDSL hydrolase family protein [Microbacterium sp. STN6]MCX7523086.1 SGNH/GDSL hydrolase family protein [Microbacterium sp. STN6]
MTRSEHERMRTAAALAATVLASAGALAAARATRARMRRNSAILNETLPVNSKWWRDYAKEKGTLLYVAIGDSAAQGIGASKPEHSYVGLLAERVRELTGQSVRVVNLSVSGATVALAVANQLPKFRKLKPDLVTVAIGANDIATFDAVVFEGGIREVFNALPKHAIVADLPCFYLPWNERIVAVANRIVREVAAERGLTIVPLHEVTRRRGLRGILTEFAADFFHPNDLGYRVWASAFLPAVSTSVRRRLVPSEVSVEPAPPESRESASTPE